MIELLIGTQVRTLGTRFTVNSGRLVDAGSGSFDSSSTREPVMDTRRSYPRIYSNMHDVYTCVTAYTTLHRHGSDFFPYYSCSTLRVIAAPKKRFRSVLCVVCLGITCVSILRKPEVVRIFVSSFSLFRTAKKSQV